MKKSILLSVLFVGSISLFGQVQSVPSTPGSKSLNVKVLLEGSFNPGTGLMVSTLNPSVPLTQPYNMAPWNYTGTESAGAIPPGVVDWVLVELRDAATPAEAVTGLNLTGWPKAFFLKSDGSVVGLDGTSQPGLGSPAITKGLFVVIRHRNHLPVLASSMAVLAGDIYSWDFTTGLAQAYGGPSGYKLSGTKAVMVAGDIDRDQNIFVSDFNTWASGFGTTGTYHGSDLDLDRNVYVSDFNKWATNFGSTTGVGSGLCRFTDSRDGREYKCAKIGTQTWMAENLAYLPSVHPSANYSLSTPYYHVYGFDGTSVSAAKSMASYATYGVLYNWAAAINGGSGSNLVPSGVQGICPSGWHLPSNAEWTVLSDYLTNNGYGYGGSGSDIGQSMASTSGWATYPTEGTIGNNQAGNNRSGFAARPGGYLYVGTYYDLLSYTFFWSASESGSTDASYFYLYYNRDGAYGDVGSRYFGFSVRCLMN